MEKPKTIKKGRKTKYPWWKLQKKGDWFEVREADTKQAQSLRTLTRRFGLKASVSEMQKGGYLVELLVDRADSV